MFSTKRKFVLKKQILIYEKPSKYFLLIEFAVVRKHNRCERQNIIHRIFIISFKNFSKTKQFITIIVKRLQFNFTILNTYNNKVCLDNESLKCFL